MKKLNIRLIYVSDNVRFGINRRGNFNFLKNMSKNFSFEVMKIDTYTNNYRERISSSAIRIALSENKLARAELGHTYLVSGQVIYGKGLGSFIGFPTLNVLLCDKNYRFPVNGVYAVKVFGVLDFPLLGVANIGHCPTIHRFSKPRLEVHLLDCKIDLYGFYIEVVICAKIRDEQIFSSIIDLKDQIKHDISNVRKYFNDL